MKVREVDKEEIKQALAILKLESFKGSSLQCPKCMTKGYFGRVINYQTELGNKYILCGACWQVSNGILQD